MLGLYFIGTVHGEKFNCVVEFCSKLDVPASAPGDKSLLGLQVCAPMLGRIFLQTADGVIKFIWQTAPQISENLGIAAV